MKIRPLRDQIVIAKPKEEEKVGSGLLYKPQTSQTSIVESEVLAVGPGRVTDNGTVVALEVGVGNIVMFNRHHATEIATDGEPVFILKEEHILCVMQ